VYPEYEIPPEIADPVETSLTWSKYNNVQIENLKIHFTFFLNEKLDNKMNFMTADSQLAFFVSKHNPPALTQSICINKCHRDFSSISVPSSWAWHDAEIPSSLSRLRRPRHWQESSCSDHSTASAIQGKKSG
jgi:hypothetical protein